MSEEKQEEKGMIPNKPNFFQRIGLLFGGKEGIEAFFRELQEAKRRLDAQKKSFDALKTKTAEQFKQAEESQDRREKELKDKEQALKHKEMELKRREEELRLREESLSKSEKILTTDDPKPVIGFDEIVTSATTREFELGILSAGEKFKHSMEQLDLDENLTKENLNDAKKTEIQGFQARMLAVLSSYISRDGTTMNQESRDAYRKLIDDRMFELLERSSNKEAIIREYVTELLDTKSMQGYYGRNELAGIIGYATRGTLEAVESNEQLEEGKYMFSPDALLDRSRGYRGYSTEQMIRRRFT